MGWGGRSLWPPAVLSCPVGRSCFHLHIPQVNCDNLFHMVILYVFLGNVVRALMSNDDVIWLFEDKQIISWGKR